MQAHLKVQKEKANRIISDFLWFKNVLMIYTSVSEYNP